MADTHTKVREVAWSELFPWLMLLRSVRIALMARVLVLGAAGLITTVIGWALLTDAFSHSTDPVIAGWRAATNLRIWVHAVPDKRSTSRGSIHRRVVRARCLIRPGSGWFKGR